MYVDRGEGCAVAVLRGQTANRRGAGPAAWNSYGRTTPVTGLLYPS